MRLPQWIKAARKSPAIKERVLPDKHGDLLDLSVWDGKLYVAVEEVRGPRVAVGPYSPAEVREALDELVLEDATEAGGRALYEALPEHLRETPAGYVMPWELVGKENQAKMQNLARVVLDAVSKAGDQA